MFHNKVSLWNFWKAPTQMLMYFLLKTSSFVQSRIPSPVLYSHKEIMGNGTLRCQRGGSLESPPIVPHWNQSLRNLEGDKMREAFCFSSFEPLKVVFCPLWFSAFVPLYSSTSALFSSVSFFLSLKGLKSQRNKETL